MNASSFTLSTNINGYIVFLFLQFQMLKVVQSPQTKESIRYNAPLQYSTQDRKQ